MISKERKMQVVKVSENPYKLNAWQIKELPEDLIQQLSKQTQPKKSTEFMVKQILKAAGIRLTTDELIIGIYKETGTIRKRPAVYLALSKLKSKGVVCVTKSEGMPNSYKIA